MCHKIKLQVTLNAKKSPHEAAYNFLPTSSSVSCSHPTHEEQAALAQAGSETAVRPTGGTARWQRAPRHPRGSCGACWWGQETWTARLQAQPVSLQQGSGGILPGSIPRMVSLPAGTNSCSRAVFRHPKASARRRGQSGVTARRPRVRDQAFLIFNGAKGRVTTDRSSRQPSKGFKQSSRPRVSPRYWRKLGFLYMSVLKWKLFCWKQKAASFPQDPTDL